ncbi:glycosyltransferase [Candidatus Saccharibacteria bacterium]|nr:glycosyltransferase [Candidatus Saccharibacteria bacterium]
MKKIDISVIVTAHKEGFLSHKTMMSILAALEEVKNEGMGFEIIIHIDNGSEQTRNYFSRYKGKEGFRILENKFGDLGLSRNFAIGEARGNYVGVIDADDLVSKNWFISAIKTIEKSGGRVVAHPNYSLAFGLDQRYVLWEQKDSDGGSRDIRLLCGVNRWVSACVAKKEIFEKCPYSATRDGYGNEDWWFNTETESMGIRHVAAKETTLFYRQKRRASSLLQASNGANCIQRYSRLFEIDYYNRIIEREKEEQKHIGEGKDVGVLYSTYKKIRNSPANVVITPVARPIRIGLDKILGASRRRSSERIPQSVYNNWREISQIETGLYPTSDEVKKVIEYCVEDGDAVGYSFFKAMEDATHLPDYVFIVPWLISGGADKVLLNYIKALSELHPDWTFAVITTLPSQNEWKEKLPSNAYIVDFGNNSKYLNDVEGEQLFSRIITQLNCKKLHIINSQYAYAWVLGHLELVKKNYKLNVSIFCHDYIKGTNDEGIFDYLDPYLLSIYDVVDNIFTDNEEVINRGEKLCGLDRKKFKVHYQPIDSKIIAPKISKNQTFRVLWAGRVAYQKAPDVLLRIVEKLDPKKVHIDMFGKLDGYKKSYFKNVSSLEYKGEYDGFETLETDSYDCYLYTSRIDGLPNCLLEATAAGLPVIAPKVGGIGEFIKEKETGLLVDNFDNVDEYVEAIKYAMQNSKKMSKMVKEAQRILVERHSWKAFVEKVREDFCGGDKI